jgi:hypothetical protein
MGQDWVRAKLRDGISYDELALKVREQKQATLELAWYWEGIYEFREEIPQRDFSEAFQRLGAAHEAIVTFVCDEDRPEGDGPRELRRTYNITRNRIIPPEWRVEAMRSFLPDELREHLSKWREYVNRLRGGEHRGYLRELLTHYLSTYVVDYWRELQSLAQRARERTNLWAQNSELIEIREQILALPEPSFHPAPVWSVWESKPHCVDKATIAIYDTLEKRGPFARLLRRWNYFAPTNNRIKPHIWDSPRDHDPLEWKIGECAGADMDEFFAWIEPACAKGMLLYFWA